MTDLRPLLNALKTANQTISELTRQRDEMVLRALASPDDQKMQVLGKPARIRIEWLDGLPFGYTEERLRDWAQSIIDARPEKRVA